MTLKTRGGRDGALSMWMYRERRRAGRGMEQAVWFGVGEGGAAAAAAASL